MEGKTKRTRLSIDDRLCDVSCELALGIKDERQRKEPWNLKESVAMTSWETGVCWRYMPYDSRPNGSDFRNEKDHGYIVGYLLSRLGKIRKDYIRVRKGYGNIRSRLGKDVRGTSAIKDICYPRLGEHISGLEHPNKHNGIRCSIYEAKTFGELQGHILTLEMIFKMN
jgi:hypothetical protein